MVNTYTFTEEQLHKKCMAAVLICSLNLILMSETEEKDRSAQFDYMVDKLMNVFTK